MITLKKAKHLLRSAVNWYQKHGENLPERRRLELETLMESLDEAIHEKNRALVKKLFPDLKKFLKENKKSHPILWFFELAIALGVALLVAILIRQMWFELMVIPTGSMRPTFQENDHLSVTKAPFGINIPLKPGHFYFDPDLVNRTETIIWSGDNLPQLPDSDSTFFGLFPYKKRYIKRLIGKPGDSLYFYGGKIYGVDKEGNPLNELLDAPAMQPLEHIPYSYFQSNAKQSGSTVIFRHFNQKVGKATASYFSNSPEIEVWDGKEWIQDQFPSTPTYSDWFGMRNFAMAKLIERGDGVELQLTHTPTAAGAVKTSLPFTDDHLQSIMDAMYTARFDVKDGRAKQTHFKDVPDGTYEFYHGVGYKVGIKGWKSKLPKDHPLLSGDKENIVRLYNQGIHFNPSYPPFRYAYFRDGDLYLLGKPIVKKGDDTLTAFLENETKKEAPFIDHGPPENLETIRKYGVTVPEKHYLVLGDNHAMSQDSRYFGFVPEDNLRGAPVFLIWPPSPRWGDVRNPGASTLITPRIIIWILAIVSLLLYLYYQRRSLRYPIFRRKK